MITEALDFRYLLIENYKKLKLTEEDVMVILVIDHLIGDGNPFINSDLLSLKMSLSNEKIDNILCKLLEKGYIEYKTSKKKTITTLNPLKKQLYREFQISMSLENEQNSTPSVESKLQNIYKTFEESLSRPISPAEYSKIREWISLGYSDDMIINALKESLSKGRKSFSSIDRILLTSKARDDIENEGHTTIDETWEHNLEETIRIAKTPWVKKK